VPWNRRKTRNAALACFLLLVVFDQGGDVLMEWTTPEFTPVAMDSEIGRYQQDDRDGL